MSRKIFYGLGEVCIVGNMEDGDSTSSAPTDVGQVCGSNDGELPSSASSSKSGTTSNTRGSLSQVTVPASAEREALEVDYLRSRLEIATRLLADREETIDILTSELTTFKSLYKETIQELSSAGSLGAPAAGPAADPAAAASPGTPGLVTPLKTLHQNQYLLGRAKSQMQLRLTEMESPCGGSECGSNPPSGAAIPRYPSTAGSPAVGLPPPPPRNWMGGRVARSYSWREGGKRSGSGAAMSPLQPLPSLPLKTSRG